MPRICDGRAIQLLVFGSQPARTDTRTPRLLHAWACGAYRLSAAAAGGAAALADVAASGGPHLRAAVQAQRRVGMAPLLSLDELGRAVRGERVPRGVTFRPMTLLVLRLLHGHRLGQFV